MTFSQTLTYLGPSRDTHGTPHPWFHYLTVARPDGTSGGATASVMSLAEAIAHGLPRSPVKVVTVTQGGTEAALKEAEKFLDQEHAGLTKHLGEPQPHAD